MPLTPDDVQNKRFTVVRFGKSGYDEEEVDSFLDEIEAEMRRLLAESNSLRAAASAPADVAPAAPAAPAEEPNETALRTLLLAQRTADDAIAQAHAESEQIINDARQRAAAVERDAQGEHAATSAELERQRAAVEAAIAELRDFERDYRTRLRAYLEGELSDLEALGRLAAPTPAGDTSPPPPVAARPDLPSPPGLAQSGATMPTATTPTLVPPAAPYTAPPPGPAPGATPFTPAPAPDIDTDVDAGSEPSGPPLQADDSTDESRE
jgi:DivIVA domain-containing protein